MQKKNISDIKLPDGYSIVGEYINNKTPVSILHSQCNKTFMATTTNVRGGSRCPWCYSSRSLEEDELVKFLKIFYPNITKCKMYIDRKAHKFYEIDAFIPELNIGFEFDGLYWHSKKEKMYHYNKTNYAVKNNIRLYHIFEDDWINKNAIIKNKIMNVLNKLQIIPTEGCCVNAIDINVKREFLLNNNLTGDDESYIAYGLFKDSILLAVLTLTRSNDELKIINYTESLGITISNGLSFFINSLSLDNIICDADIMWNNPLQNIFSEASFTFEKYIEPTKFYIDRDATFRYLTKNNSDMEIYNCGYNVYRYKK